MSFLVREFYMDDPILVALKSNNLNSKNNEN